ncbi:MAG TPA: CBS domain-containing protein [Balneolales bacterium]|nr:CBS domain-containing protein [Balneolales bacterium]
MLISEILKEKGNNVYTISPDKTVYEAISELTDKNVGALVVQNGENDVVGMF